MFIFRESEKIPGVRFAQFEGKPTDAELETYISYERSMISRRVGETRLMVVTTGDVWSSPQRKMMHDFEVEAVLRSGKSPPGMVMVVKSSLIRGAVTAYYWIAPATYPMKMVEKPEDACDWVIARLQELKVPAPSREAYLREARGPWPGKKVVPGSGLVPLTSADQKSA